MRIIAGRYRGRKLRVPEGRGLRPTSERTREALFSILLSGRLSGGSGLFPGARVLDAFAGSGALGIEAFSRGASAVCFIEQAPAALRNLHRNLEGLEPAAALRVLKASALCPPATDQAADLVLMDPPYDEGLLLPALSALSASGWIGPASLVAVEGSLRELEELPAAFDLLERRRYGRSRLSFLRLKEAGAAGDIVRPGCPAG